MRHLHQILAEFRSALLRRALSEALVWGLLGALALLVLGAAWMAWGPAIPGFRAGALAAAATAIVGTVAMRWWSERQRFPDEPALAEWLETREPALRTDVRTALELERRPRAEDLEIDALRVSLVTRVERRLQMLRARLDDLVPQRDMRRPAGALAALAAGFVILAAATPATFGAGARALIFGATTLEEEGNVVASRPLVSTVDYEILAPAYAQRPLRRVRGSTGDIEALVGSEIVFEARAMIPVSAAVLRMETGAETTRIQLEVAGSSRIRGRFTVVADATYRFEVSPIADRDEWSQAYVDQHGAEPAVDPLVRRVDALPDGAPSIELLEPPERLEVTPDEVVDLEYVARDDFGLTAISVVWHFAGDETNLHQLPLQGAVAGTEFREHVPFDLQPMNLQPRDEVVVYVEAVDNDGFSGAKSGRSRAISLRVGAPDDRHQDVLVLKEQLFEQLLGQLGGTLAAGMVGHAIDPRDDGIMLVPNTGNSNENSERVAAQVDVHAMWLPTIQVFEALLQQMEADTLSIDAERDMLQGTYDRLYDDVLNEGRALEGFSAAMLDVGVPVGRFGTAANRVADTLQTTERAVLVLEDLVATHKADNVQRAMEELGDVRDRLQEMLEQYRDTQDPEVREQIERELRRLEQRMRELMEQLASQIEQLPVEHLNADAIEPSEVAESLSEMRTAMDEIRDMLDSGDVDSALELLERLEQELSSMDDELQPLGDSQPETLSEFDESMGQLMDELNNLQAMEADVEAQTQSLLDEMIADRAAETQEQSQQALEQAMRQIEAAREQMEAVPSSRLSDEAQDALESSQEGLEMMENLLSQGDAAGAEQAATRLMSQLSDAAWELRREESMLARDPEGRSQARQAQQASADADEAVRNTRNAMRDLMEASRPRPNAQQQGQLQELGAQQNEVRQRMEQMQQQVSEMGERFPMVGEQLQPTLERAAQQMQGAEGELRGRDPRPALRSEQAARETMQQAQEQMRQLTQRQRQREQRNSPGRRPDDEVDVSGEGESGRADFRRRVVESMRDDSIEAYQEEIRRYYESLLE